MARERAEFYRREFPKLYPGHYRVSDKTARKMVRQRELELRAQAEGADSTLEIKPKDYVLGFMPRRQQINSFRRFVDAYDQNTTTNGRDPAPLEEPLATE